MSYLDDVQLLALPNKTQRKEEERKKGGNPNVCQDLLNIVDESCQRGSSSFGRRVNRWPQESDHILKH